MNQKTKIPSNIESCREIDPVAQSLQEWAHRIDYASVLVAVALIIIGVVSTIMDVKSVESQIEDVMVSVGISSGISWICYAIASFFACKLISLLIYALATITQNSSVCAKTQLYQLSKTERNEEKNEQADQKETTQQKTNEKLEEYKQSILKREIKTAKDTDAPYYCGKCGELGPYEKNCPKCGSSLRIFQ